ncbi:Rieske (2Fe-2S) protein [Pseudonocardia sp. GCM10023141]|uniref:Rieske (2Fe-2S) protein n=1 Tax=Pseudonocardia sp. GCM10023141 TaxID=3252653 RepID=UPI003618CA33
MSARDVRRFVEDLLRGRKPRPFRADEDDAAQLRTAITLRAARTGSGAPSEEFVTALQRRLAEELDDGEQTAGNGDLRPLLGTRRRVIQVGSVAAAAATIGVVADRAVLGAVAGVAAVADGPSTPDATLVPTTGTWTPVAARAAVPDGAVHPFEVGGVAGFVRRDNGRLFAVSGTCTHQGCRLALDVAARRLQCPCHNTAFAVTGELITYALPVPPRPLPQIEVRENGEMIEVFTPPPTA